MVLDPSSIAVVALGLFLIGFMRGAFGGGFAIIGIPVLSLVLDPITAGALLAPLFVVMDVVALRYWKPATWSKPELLPLIPALIVGIGLGYLSLSVLDRQAAAIVIALITLAFAGLWFRAGGTVTPRPRSTPRAVAAGLSSGIATMIAHAGGPPLAMYLLPLGLAKEIYAGTTSIFFSVANLVKTGPWLLLAKPTAPFWWLMVVCLPVAPFGVWLGWRLHQRLDQVRLYRACYGLLVITAIKLLWDGLGGYL